MRNFAILLALLLTPACVHAQGANPGGFDQAFKQLNLPAVSSTAPTNAQVLTWDSTLGKAKWATASGGADLSAATNIQFASGNGSITGVAGTDLSLASASGRKVTVTSTGVANLELTGGNQILFNSAGHYARMGLGFLNLASDGGLYFCSETTASTAQMVLFRDGATRLRLSSDIAGDDIDRPINFAIKSCDGANLNNGLDLNSTGGIGTITMNNGGAYGGTSTLRLVAGGCTVSITDTGLTSSVAKFTVGTSGPTITSGSGSPESSVTAGVGSVYLRTGASSSLWSKQTGSGNTGWLDITAGGSLSGITNSVAGQLVISTGAGAITNLLGASDQNLRVVGGVSATVGRAVTITGGAAGANANAGGAVALATGAGLTSGASGALDLLTGSAGSTADSGDINVTTGSGGATYGTSGGIYLFTGGATNGSSGNIYLGTGLAGGTDQSTGAILVKATGATGTGSSHIKLITGFMLPTGTTTQSQYDRQLITSKTFTCSTTTATANTICLLSAAESNSGVGCTVQFTIEVGDGADHWSTIHGTMIVAASNRAGTVTANASRTLIVSDTTTFTSLTADATATVSGTDVQINLAPSWSAGTPTVVRCTYQVQANGQTTLTPQ